VTFLDSPTLDWSQVDPHMREADRLALIRNHLDITPHESLIHWDLGRDDAPRRTVTATSIVLAWRGCPADFASDVLADYALQAVEERDTWRSMHTVTLGLLHDARRDIAGQASK
jgi:hypothetical protein